MVTSAVAILTVILADFTYETKLNSIRVVNQVDRYQAKLNAEAGVKFALSKLKIYQEAWNKLEDNESLKGSVSAGDAESVVTQPFVYPIPLAENANIIQKNAVADFEKNSLIKGGISVSISPLTGFLNPNTLRVFKTNNQDEDDQDNQGQNQDNQDGENNQKTSPDKFMEKTFIDTVTREFQDKIEEDEDFAELYSNLDPALLVKELKYFVNNPNSYDEPEKVEIEKLYLNADTKAKHAPMDSIEELYTLEGWDDEIVKLLIDKMSVHHVSVINVNELTLNQLKVLFPTMSKLQLEEFFKHRDGDPEAGTKAQNFKNISEFKQYLTQKAGVISEADYEKRVTEFKSAKISLGVAGKVFKVTSVGKFGETSYQITAFIDLPVKPDPPKKKDPTSKDENQTEDGQDGDDTQTNTDDQNTTENNNTNSKDDDKKDKSKTFLLPPRIVEIRQI